MVEKYCFVFVVVGGGVCVGNNRDPSLFLFVVYLFMSLFCFFWGEVG